LFDISVLLDVQANLPETSPFFVCPNGFCRHLFSNVYSTWDVQLWHSEKKEKNHLHTNVKNFPLKNKK